MHATASGVGFIVQFFVRLAKLEYSMASLTGVDERHAVNERRR